MQVVLTDHAKYRLLERGIDISHVKKVIRGRSSAKRELNGILKERGTLEDGRALEVIYEEMGSKIIIVTAYYAS